MPRLRLIDCRWLESRHSPEAQDIEGSSVEHVPPCLPPWSSVHTCTSGAVSTPWRLRTQSPMTRLRRAIPLPAQLAAGNVNIQPMKDGQKTDPAFRINPLRNSPWLQRRRRRIHGLHCPGDLMPLESNLPVPADCRADTNPSRFEPRTRHAGGTREPGAFPSIEPAYFTARWAPIFHSTGCRQCRHRIGQQPSSRYDRPTGIRFGCQHLILCCGGLQYGARNLRSAAIG
jgi:hypothetical protein